MNNVKMKNVKMKNVKMKDVRMKNVKMKDVRMKNVKMNSTSALFFLVYCFGIIVVGLISSPYQLNKSTIEAER
jgi:hypothetical protein